MCTKTDQIIVFCSPVAESTHRCNCSLIWGPQSVPHMCIHDMHVFAWHVFLSSSAHSQRLVSVQSMLRQTGRYRTLERDLMELQERKLFEYFIVVALHKTKAGVPYLPEVTQQFPLKVKCYWSTWFQIKHWILKRKKRKHHFCFPVCPTVIIQPIIYEQQ